VEKEYNIKLIVEFKGTSIGETRQEAIEEIDIPDFIDEALHSGNYKILKTTPRLSMLNTLLLTAQKDVYETDSNAELEEIDREDNKSYSRT
tara:strand:+ start:205 stop:477 length:273 start_codon:yes stop_codon:yes gene_type:complete